MIKTKIAALMQRVRASLIPIKLENDVAQAFQNLLDENERLRADLKGLTESRDIWANRATENQEDAARYRKLAAYLVSNDTSLDDSIVDAATVENLSAVIDATMRGTSND